MQHGARRVVGIGSVFAPGRRFTPRSDIDLAVEGLRPNCFFRVSVQAAAMTDFSLDFIPLEMFRTRIRVFLTWLTGSPTDRQESAP